MAMNTKSAETPAMLRWAVIITIAAVALFGSYRFAQASTASRTVPGVGSTNATAGTVGNAGTAGSGSCCGGGSATAGGTSAGGGCCGSGGSAAPATTGTAEVTGKVQKFTVDLSKGYYNPNTIELKAGVPTELTFGQGSGCLAKVQSQDLGFSQDLTVGPVTIKLPALAAGTYAFTCGMQMQSGTIVVK